MSNAITQLNVRVRKETAQKIRIDAARCSVAVEDVASAIFDEWFKAFSFAERAKQYEGVAKKKTGRPIETKPA